MTQLVESRWTRYGHDRVYLKTADGTDVGWIDLKSGGVHTADPDFTTTLEECRRRWIPSAGNAADERPTAAPPTRGADRPESRASHDETATPPPVELRPVPAPPPPRDLSTNVPGAAARAKRDEVNAKAPVLHAVARVLGVKTDERAWRLGAKGETKVGKTLAKLPADWHVLHAVEVGDRGSDIDHVVIGPAGVFTLNTKTHLGGKAWVAERAVQVNGHKTDYLRNSRHEARRASRLLSKACGVAIDVQPVIVFAGLDKFVVKAQPRDVHVTTRGQVLDLFRSLPRALDAVAADAIYSHARLSTTWR